MINQTGTEYDVIKVLREIQLMRQLNELSQMYYKKDNTDNLNLSDDKINGRNLFVPELIDIILPIP